MFQILKKSDIKKMLPVRRPASHKGENGRVLIIGGSMEYYGAPILAGLGALHGGADLVYLLVPECNFEVSRSFYPDFIVRKYGGNHINVRILDAASELLEQIDAVLIGPGITKQEDVLTNVLKLLSRIEVPTIIDADALQVIKDLESKSSRPLVITPHHGEFAALIDETFDSEASTKASDEEKHKLVLKYAEVWNTVVLLKGQIDFLSSPRGDFYANATGNPGMTVGGTGDVLAGLTASFIAQSVPPFEAACAAAFLNGYAGDNLLRQKGYGFSATDLAMELPYAIREIL